MIQARSWRGGGGAGGGGGSAPPLGNKIEIMPPPYSTFFAI